MPFDWKRFLNSNNIEFGHSGRNDIVVHCPFCGVADPSQHLGISLLGRGWRCLRNPDQHRGRSYVRLIAALIQCTEEHARQVLGEEIATLPSGPEFSERWRKQLGLAPRDDARPQRLKLPREFKPMFDAGKLARPFKEYLRYTRRYSPVQTVWAEEAYNLHYARTGDFAYRIILPIYDAEGRLMTWTGRTIRADEHIRYKTLTTALSVEAPPNLLLGLPLLWRANPTRCLVVCEGPFDAISVSVLGHEAGIYGTCLFGKNVSAAQSDLLYELMRRFERVRLLLDADAFFSVLRIKERLPKGCVVAKLPQGVKDPGELHGAMGLDFVRELAQ
jgi:hypothetical protein